jgi:hypothetical protein
MEGETLRGNRGKFCCLDREAWEKTKDMFGGNSNGIYRRELWQRHEFDESLATAEDLEWMFWAFANGYMLANIPERKVLYRNSGPLRHMFRKGYHEAKLARQMLRTEKMPLQHLGIALGSLIKRLLLGRIGPGFFLRQCAHRWGAFLGSRAAHISTKPQ